MNRRRVLLLKILLFLFVLNLFSLYWYFHFSSHPKSQTPFVQETQNQILEKENRQKQQQQQQQLPVSVTFHGKPWPILPSYLPWDLNPNVTPKSCEGYFGNGFNRRIDLLLSPSEIHPKSDSNYGGSGWFRCFYSETLGSSICEGGRLRMNPDRIRMSVGGEKLESVMGRQEEEELPSFDSGAFEIEFDQGLSQGGNLSRNGRKLVNKEFLDQFVPRGAIHMHTMRALVDSIQLLDPDKFKCSQWVEEPTLLVTRFEYANLFHTVTDWYSAYVASRVTGLPNRPHVVFLDGHCKAPLEETWEALFSSLKYAKSFSGPICFRHAILSPLGYETTLFKGLTEDINCQGATAHDLWQNPNDQRTARLSEFGELIRAAFGFPVNRNQQPKLVSGHNILFVRREDYLAHPRHGGKVESRLSNEQEVFDALKIWAINHSKCKVNLINGLFAHMSMKEQVRAIQDASVIIGAHGAGLTHVISATPNTVILEIISSQYRRPHFALISQWRGLEYHAINLAGSYAEPEVVTKKVNDIMRSLGC
ncbi:beta-1,2-xylosyltransferase-like [Telopea speciosissima]|uniref:beta-1,2-xylosyltransferase-like n=1 Tax=Telopea speciosissima TaxID=54955 RepID=UPI001CC412DE|nr:beta-1,2-xylosyltransferase-like [Telopea speciosissima]XP_043689655.1 beta-1,2-xylosyltransferase-like [Telopea speciosissima]XP_043689656.1 beta-1,2-xylosyltransferase-like [Telopea speciosissima]